MHARQSRPEARRTAGNKADAPASQRPQRSTADGPCSALRQIAQLPACARCFACWLCCIMPAQAGRSANRFLRRASLASAARHSGKGGSRAARQRTAGSGAERLPFMALKSRQRNTLLPACRFLLALRLISAFYNTPLRCALRLTATYLLCHAACKKCRQAARQSIRKSWASTERAGRTVLLACLPAWLLRPARTAPAMAISRPAGYRPAARASLRRASLAAAGRSLPALPLPAWLCRLATRR